MTRAEHEPQDTPFWHLDEALGELELRERPDGPDRYMVRLKAHTAALPYRARQELYPLTHAGTQRETFGRAYILVPDTSLTVGLFPTPKPSGAIGTVTDSAWQGMRHHEIAAVRGLYYEEDRALAIWEVDTWGRLEEFAHAKLWQSFEDWLVARFSTAERLFIDDAEPGEDSTQNREFLSALGYTHVGGTHRIFAKEIER